MPAAARSPSTSSSSSSASISSIFQYTFFAIVIYVLAGAPLSSILSGDTENATSTAHANINAGKLKDLAIPDPNLKCDEHAFKGVHILNRDPLVVYIEGFVSKDETSWIMNVSATNFAPSTVWSNSQESLDSSIRLSEKAGLPRDQVVQCIEDRARRFQGWRPYLFIEKLWAQRYHTGGHYSYHYDWSTAGKGVGRVSSFMVYLVANCSGGGTQFPRLQHPYAERKGGDREWCRFIECPEATEWSGEDAKEEEGKMKEGVVFKPIAGNAVYWENIRKDGTGYRESWHAGLPVTSGVKVGLNIWSWLQVGYDPRSEGYGDGKE